MTQLADALKSAGFEAGAQPPAVERITIDANPKPPSFVVDRKVLIENVLLEIAVPKKGDMVELDEPTPLRYLRFKRQFGNGNVGFVNCHIHGDGDLKAHLGTVLMARASVHEKRYDNGVRIVYIDLVPTERVDGETVHYATFFFGPKFVQNDQTLFASKLPSHKHAHLLLKKQRA